MQVTPGQTPLSLAMLKALGSQAAPAATGSTTPADRTPPAVGGKTAASAGDLAAVRHLPRGSFVDIKA